jgi:protein SCO1/2
VTRRATPADAADASGFRGVITSPPREKPDFTLTDFNGEPFNFRLATNGKVTLLFFGYTHCPDVCPLHVANVAAVLKKLPFEAREAIRFVFVSTDPDRDTPQRLKEWLGNFDPTFIGLRGSVDEVNRILYTLRMPPIDLSQKPAAAPQEYLVGHAAQVLAFSTDGYSRLEYPFGIRQDDWAHDLPKLARGELPNGAPPSGPGAVDLKPMAEGEAPAVAIRVAAALMPQPATTTEGALYLVLRNGASEDTLYAVESPASGGASVHETMPGDKQAMGHMMPVSEVVLRAGETLQFLPGARHIMLFDFKVRPSIGDAVPLRLRFRKAGDVIVVANVVAYADVERMLAAAVSSLGQ